MKSGEKETKLKKIKLEWKINNHSSDIIFREATNTTTYASRVARSYKCFIKTGMDVRSNLTSKSVFRRLLFFFKFYFRLCAVSRFHMNALSVGERMDLCMCGVYWTTCNVYCLRFHSFDTFPMERIQFVFNVLDGVKILQLSGFLCRPQPCAKYDQFSRVCKFIPMTLTERKSVYFYTLT